MNSIQSSSSAVHNIPKWNAEKNQFLTEKYKKLKGSKQIWIKLAELINEKFSMSVTNDQVKHHHANCRIDVDRSSLTEEEADKLREYVQKYGNDWKKIGALMKRTPNKVKAYYNTKLKPLLPQKKTKVLVKHENSDNRSGRKKKKNVQHLEDDCARLPVFVPDEICSLDGVKSKSGYNLRPRKVNPANKAHMPLENKEDISFEEPHQAANQEVDQEEESNNSTLLVSRDEYFHSGSSSGSSSDTTSSSSPQQSVEDDYLDLPIEGAGEDFRGYLQEYQDKEQNDCDQQISPIQIDVARILEQNPECCHWSLLSKNITQLACSSSSLMG